MSAMKVDGACHCGRIRFRATVDPSRVMVCHCTDCQTLSGAPMRAVVVAPLDTFELEGEPKRYVKVAESGNRRVNAFCPECGTPLFATAPENATSVVLRVGTLRQRDALKPVLQIWHRSAQPWVQGIDGVPASERQEGFLGLPPAPPPDAAARG